MENTNDFLESLKVSNTTQQNVSEQTRYSDRDVYTCLKLMRDFSKFQSFLLETKKQETEDKKFLPICQ